MPTNLHRYYGAGYSHFITTSCYQRRPLLGTARSRDLFLEVMEQIRQRHEFVVVGYVVMPEHVHLLFTEPERGNPSLAGGLETKRLLIGNYANFASKPAPGQTRFGVHLSPWDTFGNAASTISLFLPGGNALKSCATCTAILCNEV
jgi:hypothetical protein